MSIRASMLELSAKTGIKPETLRKRWAKGLRGEALLDTRGMQEKNKPVRAIVKRPSLAVRAPEVWER
jgi:hypothetical protein